MNGIDSKSLANLLKIEFLSLGLPGDSSQSSSLPGSTGGQGFSDMLASILGPTGSMGSATPAANQLLQSQNTWSALAQMSSTQWNPLSFLPIGQASAVRQPQPADQSLSTNPSQWDSVIENVSNRYNLPVNLIKSVIAQESGFQPDAISKAGAQGLMQLMPATARALGVDNPFDPMQNIDGGTRYLKQLLDRFHGRIDLALAAYNAGPGAVEMYGGIPPYKETQSYVETIMNRAGLA
ncbi:lytic transglycosylase domain-containing protein [Fodinisporobacter ferrooxydans]|uniref:Lytic transglycosylase domain-containing protein n=1 Tax=Fodinisporobacter ferrooxydans TaxID=2901836 RepID=A0ABY4CLX2_9BACL|nr:lytic transglycosylase domain-containing protein [Alicyclobacillaceae bacterium MYW30-H2]